MKTLNFDFDLRFLDDRNWKMLYALSMEKLANHENSVLKDLWRGFTEEASFRSTGSGQHSEIVIRLEGVPADTTRQA